jgi:hypothetical protein
MISFVLFVPFCGYSKLAAKKAQETQAVAEKTRFGMIAAKMSTKGESV